MGEQRSAGRTAPRLAAMDDVLRWVTVVGTVLGMVLYSNWLLEFAIDFSLPDPDAFISELAASDQPFGAWFRGLDLAAAGCLAAAAAAGISRSVGFLERFGWWMVGAFAATTVLDSTVWSLRCAPHSDALCAAREAAGALPLGHSLHTLSSITAIVVAFGSLIAFVIADAVHGGPQRTSRLGQVVLGALSLATVWTVTAVAIDDTGRDGDVGLAQRAQLLAVAGWLIYVALRSARHRPTGERSIAPVGRDQAEDIARQGYSADGWER